MMRILVLTHEFPPVGGGGGRVAQDIAAGLAARGHDVRVLTAHLEGLPLAEDAGGALVERLPSGRKSAFRAGLAEMARYNWQAVRAGRRLLRAWRPDVIHAHFAVPAGAAAYTLARLARVPYVLTVHLGDVPGAVPEKTDNWFRWIQPFTPPIWRNAARVVAVSQFTRQLALQHYNIPVQVIPNGVELASLPARQPTPGGCPRIVFAGRFMEQKNPGHLVQALGQLRGLDWECAMLGDGPLLEIVRAQAASAGLAGRISLPGWVTPDQVLDEFARSHLMVLPSRSEGLPVVGVQALGMGLALLLSDAGGNQELVRDGENGFIFPAGDVEMLTARLKTLLENPGMLQSAQKKSRELAQEYDLPAIVSEYEQLFLELKTATTGK